MFNGRKENSMVKMLKGVIVVAFLVVSGCALNSLFSFTADIGDTPFKAIGSWEETDLGGVPTGQIFAVDIKGNIFMIGVAGAFEERTYELGLSGPNMFEAFARYIVLSEEVTYQAQSGTLTVTGKTPERLQGTFTMTLAALGSDTILEVTNGEFDVTKIALP
jgi:hypothetical protein